MKRTVALVIVAALLCGGALFIAAISETQSLVINAGDLPPIPQNPYITSLQTKTNFEANNANGTNVSENVAAERLYYLGMLSGSSDENGELTFDTGRDMTRLEAAVIVVRLLGAEQEALDAEPVDHYVDVPEWGKPYVDYLYSKDLVEAPDAVYFNPSKAINTNSYIKYLLYALGYSFDGSDYGGNLASFVGEELGICESSYYEITRGKAFLAAYNALNTQMKNSTKLLSEKLVEDKKMEYNDAVFLLWSNDTEKTEQYMMLSGYHIGKMLPDGYYSVTLSANGYSMNVLASGSNADYDGIGLTLWKQTNDITQRFRLERTERGTYIIYAACSRGGYNRVLGFNPVTSTLALYRPTSLNASEFYIRSTGDRDGSWYIIPAKRPSSYTGGFDYTSGGSTIVMNSADSDEKANKWIFTQQGAVTGNGDEVALYPSDVLYITQGAYEGFSHGKQNAIDLLTMGGRAYSPFTGTIKRIILGDLGCNAVFVQSNSKVHYADGTFDYMTVVFMHDNFVSDLYVGQVLMQGEYFYDMGTAGYAVGRHIHIYCIRGEYYDGMPFTGSGDINVEDALSILPDTAVIDSNGINWRVYSGK